MSYFPSISALVQFFFFFLILTLSEWRLHRTDDKMIDESGAIGGMKTERVKRGTRRKTSPVPLCSSQIQDDPAWHQTWPAAVESRPLITRAMAKPPLLVSGDKPIQKLLLA